LRQALDGERVQIEGETLTLPLSAGRGMRLMVAPVQERLPIYLAAIGPNNTKLAGEIADGQVIVLLSPDHISLFREQLAAGAAVAGRSLDGFEIVASVTALVSDDLDAARDAMRPVIGMYVGGMGPRENNFFNRLVQSYGFADAAREVQDLFLDGKRADAMAAIPPELIDHLALCGPADRIRERLQVYRDAGVGTVSLAIMAPDKQSRMAQLRQFAELAQT